MRKLRYNNTNSGFSLIEMIVVFAIMGALVGGLAPVLVKYVEKSREAVDMQSLSDFHRCVQVGMTNEEAHEKLYTGVHNKSVDELYGTCTDEFEELSKEIKETMPIKPEMKSDVGKSGDLYVKIENGLITVYVYGVDADDKPCVVASDMIKDRNGNPQKFEVTESW